MVRVCPAEFASLLLKCLIESTSNFGPDRGGLSAEARIWCYVMSLLLLRALDLRFSNVVLDLIALKIIFYSWFPHSGRDFT
jgi:hypothetical protein